MSLVRLRNRDYFPARQAYHGVDDMFNWFLKEAPEYSGYNSYPAANISETDDEFKIEMLVPGYNKEDIRIQVENGVLTVKYDVEDRENSENEKWVSREFYSKAFSRRFKLSSRLASEKISASYNNGVLELIVPKNEEAKPKPVQEIKIV